MKITVTERSCKSQSRVVINRERKTPRGPVSGEGVRRVVSWCGKNYQEGPHTGCLSQGAVKMRVVRAGLSWQRHLKRNRA